MDATNSINYLIEKGVEEEKARTLVVKMIEAMNKDGALDEMSDDKAELLIRRAIDKHFARPQTDFVRGVVIGFSNLFDENKKDRKFVLDTYAKDPQYAIAEGMVRVDENNNVIPLHYKEFIGKNNDIKNRMFGTEIKPFLRRTVYVLVDGELKQFKSSETPEIGVEYKIYGTVADKYINGVRKGGMIKVPEQYSKDEIWDGFMAFADEYEFNMADCDQVAETDLKTLVTLKASVKQAGISKKGKFYLVLEDENSYEELLTFSGNEIIERGGIELSTGMEVFVFGNVSGLGDKNIINVMGYWINPTTAQYSDIIDTLDSVLCVGDE